MRDGSSIPGVLASRDAYRRGRLIPLPSKVSKLEVTSCDRFRLSSLYLHTHTPRGISSWILCRSQGANNIGGLVNGGLVNGGPSSARWCARLMSWILRRRRRRWQWRWRWRWRSPPPPKRTTPWISVRLPTGRCDCLPLGSIHQPKQCQRVGLGGRGRLGVQPLDSCRVHSL